VAVMCVYGLEISVTDAVYLGFRFYYADERTEEGKPVGMAVDGEAHAELYLRLASEEKPVEWQQTFVKGKGYVKF
jgi:hypothetical protein